MVMNTDNMFLKSGIQVVKLKNFHKVTWISIIPCPINTHTCTHTHTHTIFMVLCIFQNTFLYIVSNFVNLIVKFTPACL